MQSNVLNHLVIGPESTYGTPVTPSVTIPVRPGGGIVTNPTRSKTQQMRAELQDAYQTVDGVAEHSGQFTSDFLYDVIGHIFKSALGAPSSAAKGGESVVYEHTFTESATKIGYTAEQHIGALTRRFAGVIFPRFKIIIDPANPAITVEFDAKGKSNATASPVTPAPSNSGIFAFDHAAISIASSLNSNIRKVELEYNNGAQMIATLAASKDPHGFVLNKSMLNLTMEVVLESSEVSEYTALLDGTIQRFDLDLTGASIGNSSNQALNIGVPRMQYMTGEPTYLPDGVAILPIVATGLSSSAAFFDQFLLTNLEANYN